MRPKLTKELLAGYVQDRKTVRQIQEITGYALPTIYAALRRFDISPFDRAAVRTGDRSGMLVVTGRVHASEVGIKRNQYVLLCDCECGAKDHIVRSDVFETSKSCGCLFRRTGKDHHGFRGHEQITMTYWGSLQKGAAARKIPFEITIEEAWDLFVAQEGRCALTGEPIHFGTVKTAGPKTASLDRIDSQQGYTSGNIQWVHLDVNFLKRNWPEQKLVAWCGKITAHASRRTVDYNRAA